MPEDQNNINPVVNGAGELPKPTIPQPVTPQPVASAPGQPVAGQQVAAQPAGPVQPIMTATFVQPPAQSTTQPMTPAAQPVAAPAPAATIPGVVQPTNVQGVTLPTLGTPVTGVTGGVMGGAAAPGAGLPGVGNAGAAAPNPSVAPPAMAMPSVGTVSTAAPVMPAAAPTVGQPATPGATTAAQPMAAAVGAASAGQQPAAANATPEMKTGQKPDAKEKKKVNPVIWVVLVLVVVLAAAGIWWMSSSLQKAQKTATTEIEEATSAAAVVTVTETSKDVLRAIGQTNGWNVTEDTNLWLSWRSPGAKYLNSGVFRGVVSVWPDGPAETQEEVDARVATAVAGLEAAGYQLDANFTEMTETTGGGYAHQVYSNGEELIAVGTNHYTSDDGVEYFGLNMLEIGKVKDVEALEAAQKALFTENQVLARLPELSEDWQASVDEENTAWRRTDQAGVTGSMYQWREHELGQANLTLHEEKEYEQTVAGVKSTLVSLGYKEDTERTWQGLSCTTEMGYTFYTNGQDVVALGAEESWLDLDTYLISVQAIGSATELAEVEAEQLVPMYASSAWTAYGAETLGEEQASRYVELSVIDEVEETTAGGQTYYAVNYDPRCDVDKYFVYYTMQGSQIDVAYEGFVKMSKEECAQLSADAWLDEESKSFLAGKYCSGK